LHKMLSKLPILFKKYPDVNWKNALAETQIESKFWLVKTLINHGIVDLGNVMVVGGWIGLLGNILLNQNELNINFVRSFDIDMLSVEASDELNKELETANWKFKAFVGDWDELNYSETIYRTRRISDSSYVDCQTRFDTIINTCCEHMASFSTWLKKIPDDRLLILQSYSDSNQEGHVNTCSSIEEFAASCQLEQVLFQGQMKIRDHYRFMLVGFKGVRLDKVSGN
jgi:hypothetical protein